LPETDLSILKIKDDALKNHATNQVVARSGATADPLNKPDVPLSRCRQRPGPDLTETNGETPFDYIATCRLTDDMDGFPRITEFRGLRKNPAESQSSFWPKRNPDIITD